MEEKWKNIKVYNGLYQISNYGNIRSTEKRVFINKRLLITKRVKLLKPRTSKHGYLQITIKHNKCYKSYLMHRLVAIHFLPNKSKKLCVNHKDMNKSNNNVLNLEWVTHKENTIHFFNNGNPYNRFGKNNGRAKMVIDTNTGIIYDTISDANKTVSISQPYLSMMLSGKRKNITTLSWNIQIELDEVFNLK